jgi:hypothetical protein
MYCNTQLKRGAPHLSLLFRYVIAVFPYDGQRKRPKHAVADECIVFKVWRLLW